MRYVMMIAVLLATTATLPACKSQAERQKEEQAQTDKEQTLMMQKLLQTAAEREGADGGAAATATAGDASVSH